MMLVPRKNSFDLFDNIFNDEIFSKNEKNFMKTDVIEKKDKYILNVDLPGFEKENIDLSLDNGYLTIFAKKINEEENEESKYVRQERFYGECSRSFYVGDQIKEEDIMAKFNNGILNIEVPKKNIEDESNETKKIEIM